MSLIELRGVKKRYIVGEQEILALNGIDLTIEQGEYAAIIGPSGSGKSTLMHLLGCLDTPTEGTMMLDGVDVSKASGNRLSEMRNQKIGFVFQSFNLLLRSTAVQNVELPLFYAGVRRDERRRRARAALDAVALGDRADHLPGQLSGGQQQKVALARAIVTRPNVVLADEPTGNLDSHSQAEVLGLIAGLHAEGATIVMVTHSRVVAEHGTRIVAVLDGVIDADETLAAPVAS